MCDRCLRSGDTEALGQTLEGCGGVSCLCSSKEELRPPAQAASCRLCPLGRPPVPSLARAGMRPSHGAPAPAAAGPQQAKDPVSWVGRGEPRAAAAPRGGAGAATSPLSRDFSTQGAAPQKGHNPQEPLRAASSSYSFVPET